MKFAYADPPYLGCGRLYVKHHADATDWDNIGEHRRLIQRLSDEYVDGWALSASSTSLRAILPLCPDDVRVGAWTKPFAIFKPNVGVAYAWEPVIFRGGRKVTREEATRRDWLAENITLKKGLTGAKPARFCEWVFSLLNAKRDDTLDDLFPGTGIVGDVWRDWTTANDDRVEIGGIRAKPAV
jgi:hypothetical protein